MAQISIYKIYDNGGATLDRYTVLTEPFHFGKTCEALSLSDNPTHPQYGFSQWSEAFDGDHLGKEISFDDLPENVQNHIAERLSEDDN